MDAVEEIKSRLSVEDVISEYVQLKRSGRNFKGLSPFTNEKSPSFMVSPEKQIWHDFSSGKGGDIFSFIMEVEGLDFKGSLEILARKSGVDLDEFRPKGAKFNKSGSKERLYEAVEAAVGFYQVQLTKNEKSLKYLRNDRAFEKQTLLDFKFGYSPKNGSALSLFLEKKGFEKQELKKAGLITERSGSVYDMFRDRVMIPLLDPQGRAVGFTARQLDKDKNSPKYINTPATAIYDKGRQVFGLSQAKESIRKFGYVVVVEGNLDVVASHQAGIKQVVASAGTALTTYHLKSLQRFTGDVRLAFDDDNAGQAAAERTIPLAQQLGIELSILKLPSGKDPDDLIRIDSKAWVKTVENPQYMIDWLIDRIESSVDIKSAQGKRQFTNGVLKTVKQLKDKVEQEHYISVIAKKTNTSEQTIKEKFSESSKSNIRLKRVKSNYDEPKIIKEQRLREQHLLAISMKQESVGLKLRNLPLDIFSEEAQETAGFISEHPGISPNDSEYGKMLALLFEEYYQHTDEDELAYQANNLISRLVQTYAKLKKQTLLKEMNDVEGKNQQTLLRAVKQLDDLVVQFSK